MLHQAYGVMRNRAGQVGCPQLFESTRGGGKTAQLSRQCCALSEKRCPFSGGRCSRCRHRSVAASRALRAHSASFRFSAFTARFLVCNRLIVSGFTGEDCAVFSCVKILCNPLFHSVLRVKAKGRALGFLPSPSALPWQGALCSAFFFVSPTVHFLKSR